MPLRSRSDAPGQGQGPVAGEDPFGDDDLFTPTLGERDDAIGFGRAFNPQSLWLASFFGGPICAALLFAINARRLGQQRLALHIGLGFGAVALTCVALGAWYAVDARLAGESLGLSAEETSQEASRNMRLAMRVAGVALGGVGYWLQRQRFRLFLHTGHEPAKALGPSILAIVVASIIALAIAFVVTLALV
ncbi:hypothetical protein Pla163_23630 [Planctomycetes bacterium Pla163]|uniref:Uncharacterized protein n=1 Tax=Rohdeia mirabilis TaxID=2528008 RepID=A0A518D1C9_9BACT|nr:hypothetical protein Pla163_23630 [Planctomycetes bacterium Pla163]